MPQSTAINDDLYESDTDVGTDRNILTCANHDDVRTITQCRG